MLSTTMDAIRANMKADPTLSATERTRLLYLLRGSGAGEGRATSEATKAPAENRLLRRHEVARRLSISVRTLDKWTAQGLLHKRKLPGFKRACGFVSSEVEALIAGGQS